MINFRFHLVSLVAVFLALTVGIVVGATIVNQAIVDGLNSRIDTVEKNADTQRGENRVLSATAKQMESYLQTAAPYVVEGRLTGVPVVVVAEHGVDGGAVRGLVTLLHDAGAQTPAIVWLQSKWLLDQPDERTRLAEIVGVDTASVPSTARAPTTSNTTNSSNPANATLRGQALDALARRLATAVSPSVRSSTRPSPSTTTTKATTNADLLGRLTSAGFVSIEAAGPSGTTDLSTFPPPGARVVVVSGATSDLAPAPLFASLVAAFSKLAVPTIAGEVYYAADTQPARGAVLAPIRDDHTLGDVVSTVDDVELVQGQVAVVLATAESGVSKVGHYGYGSGADKALPAWNGP